MQKNNNCDFKEVNITANWSHLNFCVLVHHHDGIHNFHRYGIYALLGSQYSGRNNCVFFILTSLILLSISIWLGNQIKTLICCCLSKIWCWNPSLFIQIIWSCWLYYWRASSSELKLLNKKDNEFSMVTSDKFLVHKFRIISSLII